MGSTVREMAMHAENINEVVNLFVTGSTVDTIVESLEIPPSAFPYILIPSKCASTLIHNQMNPFVPPLAPSLCRR